MAIALVTGGAGFIGRELVHQLYLAGHHIVVVDAETYAARPDLLQPYRDRLRYIRHDVNDLDHLYDADVVFHLAAETHVCNSVDDARKFLQTNVIGTYRLLERIRGLRAHDRPLLLHMSTDEVYGDVDPGVESLETDPMNPSSPYAASKAAADALVKAWARTYGLRTRIVRPSNCYGLNQFPEKLIPKTIRSWQLGRPMTIHGDGSQTRCWLSVEDCARALLVVWQRGEDGGIYNVPGNSEVSVKSVVGRIHALCAEATDPSLLAGTEFGHDRPGGDRRYFVNGDRLRALGWEPRGDLWTDLEQIVRLELKTGVTI